jgi:ABC-2 type transport system permease protein
MISFIRSVWYLTGRALRVTWRTPWALIPNFAISLFFLLVYNGGLSGIAALPQFGGHHYIAFILPVAVVSGAVGGAGGSGQALVRDFESGYLTKLAITPVSRAALLLAPMITGMLQLIAQTLIILLVALTMGLRLPHGLAAFLGLLAFTAGWGLAFSGYAVAMALKSRNGQAAQAATFIFFPLLFLSDTFVPTSLIHADWMRWAVRLNPTTYVFNAMRGLLDPSIPAKAVWHGAFAIAAAIAVTLTWAFSSAKESLAKRS